MDVMTFVPTLQIPTNTIDEQLRNFSRRAQRVCYENERSNLLALTQLILNSFLDDQVRGTRIIDAIETREITDFFIMFEKCLWHGFLARKPPVSSFNRRKQSEIEIWKFIGLVSKENQQMQELYKNVCAMTNLSKPLSKFRAFWRLAMMQKRLAEYFECIFESIVKNEFYEPWSLLRDDNCAFLCGAFLALGVFDCNLLIDNDQLLEQINSFNLTPYLRLPTLPGHIYSKVTGENDINNDNKTCDSEEYTELKTILDQKQYLEERNRQLSVNLEQLKRKLQKADIDESASLNEKASDSIADDRSLIFTERLRDLEREREILRARLAEKEDNLRIIQEQLDGTKRFTEDLYEKLLAADSKVKRLQRDMRELKGMHENELNQLNNSLQSFKLLSNLDQNEHEIDSVESKFHQEITNKTHEYMEAMNELKKKQADLSAECEHSEALKRRCAEFEARNEVLSKIEKEFIELREDHKKCRQELSESKLALKEFSEALSESKLRIVEIKEELMPLSEAKWIKDSETLQCRLCDVNFSVMQRRHHCRNCGQIFCNACSSGRLSIPSSSNPVRVCLNCYHLLRNRQLSIESIVDQSCISINQVASTSSISAD